jgi:hypothetical protein
MKRLHFGVVLFAAMAGSGLQAQVQLQANVPFEFRMGQSNFPAGDYEFRCSGHLLVVHQERGDRSTAMSLTLPVSRIKAPETGVVEFKRYGDTYFLAKIWSPNSPDGAARPKTPLEKELAQTAPPIRTEAILIKTK